MTPSGLSIMLCVTPVDLRASFDGLARAVKERLGVDAKVERAMYVFINKQRDKVKVLWRDNTGWCVLAKRLDSRVVALPRHVDSTTTSVAIDARALAALLDGVESRRETKRDIAHEAREKIEQHKSTLNPQPLL